MLRLLNNTSGWTNLFKQNVKLKTYSNATINLFCKFISL